MCCPVLAPLAAVSRRRHRRTPCTACTVRRVILDLLVPARGHRLPGCLTNAHPELVRSGAAYGFGIPCFAAPARPLFLGDDMRPPGASTLVRHAPRFATCARGLYPPKTRLPRCRDCLHPLPKAVRPIQTKFLFQRAIYCGHAICISAVMFQPPYQPAPSAEPTPTFASDAEIELAARLRQQLEARYLQPSAGPPANPSVDVH
jgi:hypothetical protein